MEQNNLIVTSDGKTWDEVTRDVSYIGNQCLSTGTDTAYSWQTLNIFDEWRGLHEQRNYFNKDWAIAYDRFICLKDGQYQICRVAEGDSIVRMFVNGTTMLGATSTNDGAITIVSSGLFKRGDYLQFEGENRNNLSYGQVTINRI